MIGFLALVGLGSSCIPAHLQKYRRGGAGPTPAMNNGSDSDKAMFAKPQQKATVDSKTQATIYAIDDQTYRFLLKSEDVWDTALSVLLKNYNLTIVDKNSGIVTTEWDSFYLNNKVYRNKISMRVRRISWNQVDVTIRNNVERLHDATEAAGSLGTVWLPSDDIAGETARIVQNMALVLNQPPPILPPGTAVAKERHDVNTENKY